MEKSVSVVKSGLNALGDKAKDAINKLVSAFDKGKSSAEKSGKAISDSLNKGLQSGYSKMPSISSKAISTTVAALNTGAPMAMAAGANISRGFANGMLSQMATIERAAARMASAADKALRAKAKIHSPSKVSTKDGQYWGQGYVNGLLDKVRDVKSASQKLVQMPNLESPNLSFAYAGGLGDEYEYYRNNSYTIEVPVVIDGKEVAKVTAPYTEEELNKRERRENRKNGRA